MGGEEGMKRPGHYMAGYASTTVHFAHTVIRRLRSTRGLTCTCPVLYVCLTCYCVAVLLC